MHFRGLREFAWNGYDIRLTVPGLHHIPLTNMTVPTIEDDYAEKEAVLIETIGGMLRKHIDGAPLRQAFDKLAS